MGPVDVQVAKRGECVVLLAGCGSLTHVGGDGSWVPAFIWLVHGGCHAPVPSGGVCRAFLVLVLVAVLRGLHGRGHGVVGVWVVAVVVIFLVRAVG